MDQISVLIESMCSIRDDDLRLIERKQVESYKDLPQMTDGIRNIHSLETKDIGLSARLETTPVKVTC
jgi:hypothetical protein